MSDDKSAATGRPLNWSPDATNWRSLQCVTGYHDACGWVGVALGCDCGCHNE